VCLVLLVVGSMTLAKGSCPLAARPPNDVVRVGAPSSAPPLLINEAELDAVPGRDR